MNFGQHELEGARHDPVDFLGIEAFGEGCEAGDVHEEDGYLLPLALEGTPRGQDFFGEVARRVRPWLARADPGRGVAPAEIGSPQPPQKRSAGSFANPQRGHKTGSACPHARQNLRAALFSV
jgi:hypothetical protein